MAINGLIAAAFIVLLVFLVCYALWNRRLIRALKLSELRYRGTVENAVEGIIQTSRQGKFVFINPAFARMLGYSSPEEMGRLITDIETQIYVDPEVRRDFLKRLDRDKKARCEYEAWKKDGTTTWLFVSSRSVTDDRDAFLYYESIAEDISERREREAELARIAEALAKSNQDLERFANTVAHDLTEPLRTIHVYSQLLVEKFQEKVAPESKQYVDYITGATRRMKSFIDDILSFSKVGWNHYEPEWVDLNLVVKDVIQNLHVAIEESKASIEVSVLPSVPGERAKLQRVFQNLLNNALKFRGERLPTIKISAELNGKRWTFAISDNGIGIEERKDKKVFDLFARFADPSKYSGSGMGLALCKRIVEFHGGKIWYQSRLGDGTTIYFSLPSQITERVVSPKKLALIQSK